MREGPATAPFFLMRITCTRNVMASGQALEAGCSYDVSDKDGALLISMGKAVEAKALEVDIADPKPEPKTKRRRASKDEQQ